MNLVDWGKCPCGRMRCPLGMCSRVVYTTGYWGRSISIFLRSHNSDSHRTCMRLHSYMQWISMWWLQHNAYKSLWRIHHTGIFKSCSNGDSMELPYTQGQHRVGLALHRPSLQKVFFSEGPAFLWCSLASSPSPWQLPFTSHHPPFLDHARMLKQASAWRMQRLFMDSFLIFLNSQYPSRSLYNSV